jgi:hypothetical protein
MPRITTVTMESASQEQRQFLTQAQRAKGGVLPGIARIMAADLQFGGPVSQLYQYLNRRPALPIPKLQREMLITVVNGLIGGKP